MFYVKRYIQLRYNRFSDWQYIYNEKSHGNFFVTVLTWENGLSTIYCWPSGSIKGPFSLFSVHSELSLLVSIFFHYFSMKRSECICFTSYGGWSSLRGLKMVRTGGFQPWNSREPIMTDSRNVVHSLERATQMHLDHNTEKNNEKSINCKRKSRVK